MKINYKNKIITIDDKIVNTYNIMHGELNEEAIEYILYTGNIDENTPNLNQKIEELLIKDLKIGIDISNALKKNKGLENA